MVADIPGLIEGAHTGAGLGTQFLRHIERTRLLVHLVDVSDASGRPDPVKDFEVILGELASFGADLEDKPTLMVASKIDVVNKDKLAKLKRYCKRQKLELFPISAVTGEGVERAEIRHGGKSRGAPEAPPPPAMSSPFLCGLIPRSWPELIRKKGGHLWPPFTFVHCALQQTLRRNLRAVLEVILQDLRCQHGGGCGSIGTRGAYNFPAAYDLRRRQSGDFHRQHEIDFELRSG